MSITAETWARGSLSGAVTFGWSRPGGWRDPCREHPDTFERGAKIRKQSSATACGCAHDNLLRWATAEHMTVGRVGPTRWSSPRVPSSLGLSYVRLR